jgi:hypothetical protein
MNTGRMWQPLTTHDAMIAGEVRAIHHPQRWIGLQGSRALVHLSSRHCTRTSRIEPCEKFAEQQPFARVCSNYLPRARGRERLYADNSRAENVAGCFVRAAPMNSKQCTF